jgi:cell division transport system permease protein
MGHMAYSTKTAFQSLMKEKWINLLSVFTVAASLLVSAMALITIYNVEMVTRTLPEKFTMMIYLKDGIGPQDIENLMSQLIRKDYVARAKYISGAQALTELKRTLRDVSNLIEGLDENPLSAAIELKLKKESVTGSSVKNISADIRKLPGVEDVYYEEKIAEKVALLKTSIENFSLIILGIIIFVVLFVISSTVKILFYRRKSEIEIIKLLGATGGFIRAPFLIEGGVIGMLGGLFATLGATIFYFTLTTSFSAFMPLLRTLIMPVEIVVLMPIAGILMGVAGSLISVGRLRL